MTPWWEIWGEGCLPILRKLLYCQHFVVQASEVNDSLYELHRLVDPKIQVIFFHGLPLGDFSKAHLSTWESRDGSCIWPQTWLVEKFPDARILSVSYCEGMKKGSVERFDMFIIGENLLADLIGQLANCPIVLVGHCIGGLVIKQLCLQAHDRLPMASRREKANLEAFLDNIRGIFCYGTPHRGSSDLAKAAEEMRSPLFEYVEILSKEAARMNSKFDDLHLLYPKWQIRGLGESQNQIGTTPYFLPHEYCSGVRKGWFREVLLVPEASARKGDFRILADDHYSICKPGKTTSTNFTSLVELMGGILSNWKEEILKRDEMRQQEQARAHEEAQPRNLQHLPNEAVGIDVPLEEVISKLQNSTRVGLVGMGGVGKTTLAKAIFNRLSLKFDYSCFVPHVKLIKGTEYDTLEAMWKHMHYKGRKVGKEDDWSRLKGKRLLLILDDIADGRDVTILSDVAKDCSPESRFIATSRDHELLKVLEMYEVPFLEKSNAEELFRSHAFPNGTIIPHNIAAVMVDVVKKCGGLPLALEVLGRYLGMKKDVKLWKQVVQALDKGQSVTAHERLWTVLRLSYDGLAEIEKRMFLDVTTFFTTGGFSLREAKAAWKKAYKTDFEALFWQTLVDRSLVSDVEEDEQIQVHEQLQSLGRMIVAQCNKPCEAWECNQHGPCRVWEEQMALKLLQAPDTVKNEEFHSVQLQSSSRGVKDEIHTASLALHKLKKLRFLSISVPIVINGSEEDDSSLHQLVVLNCVGLNVFKLALQSSLVVLKLFQLDVENLPACIGQLSSLQIFVLHHAEKLKGLPDEIGHLSQLESLELRYCENLQNLPETFGQLSKLTRLEFFDCSSLCALPNSFGRLSALEQLVFVNCEQLRSLPEGFGALAALVKLKFSDCGDLKTLPESFGHLSALSQLYFRCCSFESLPDSFEQLSCLTELELVECEDMWSLVPFGQLLTLTYLKISGEYDFGDMKSLPDSLAGLEALGHLVLDSVSVESIPDYINNIPSLHTLELHSLPYVKVLPDWLGNMGVIPLALSHKIFQMQEGCFSLTYEKESIPSDRLIKLLHLNAMKKVRKEDYEGALADLCPGDLGEMELKWKGFLLQERGILKCLISQKLCPHGPLEDHHGALKDLNAALEVFSQENDLHHFGYDCWKHRGYLNSLLGNIESAKSDGAMALKILSRHGCPRVNASSLGDKSLAYLGFKLKGLEEIRQESKDSAHSQVMEKVRTEDYTAALAIWNALDIKLSGYYNRVYFFQERGILRRLTGDLQGALEDLTAALQRLSCFSSRCVCGHGSGPLAGYVDEHFCCSMGGCASLSYPNDAFDDDPYEYDEPNRNDVFRGPSVRTSRDVINEFMTREEELANGRQNVLSLLTEEAQERLTQIKLKYPDKATLLEEKVVLLSDSGLITKRVNKELLNSFLDEINKETRRRRSSY